MKQISFPRADKRRDHRDHNVDSQIHKLIDAPPYNSIRLTSHGIEAIRSESETFRALDSWRAPESEYPGHGNRKLGKRDERNEYGRGYTREGSYKANEEDINSEAEKFIEMEHQKLNLRKWMSTNSISY